jgi:hypothetical protein
MDSSVQNNPAAPTTRQETLKALLNSVLGWYSNTHFTQQFFEAAPCTLPLEYQAASSQARL